jgi:hypothetical protein
MYFRAERSFHVALLNVPRLVSVEITHAHWFVVFCVVRVIGTSRGDPREGPARETQVTAKSFVPTNAFLFVERLLDQQLRASRVQWTGAQRDWIANV